MARISPTVEDQFSVDQSGFSEGRPCASQVLNLTRYIEDGFETRKILGAVFIELTAAYGTINHRALLLKVGQVIKNSKIVHIMESLLRNRRFFVEMDGKQSRSRSQKNGLPQGSFLAPTLFHIYTNDLPTFADIPKFFSAYDLCLETQGKSSEEIERRLSCALETLSCHYQKWFLNPNPGKTKVCCFHLNNRNAARTLKIQWEGKELENTPYPVLSNTGQGLLFKSHIENLRKKISPRNNLIGILANSS